MSTTQERLVQKQSWEQKGGAAWVPSPCSWHLLVPHGSRGQAVPTKGAELQWKKPLDQQGSHCDGGGEQQELAGQGLPPASCPVSHESEDARQINACPFALLSRAEFLHAPQPLRIWTPVSHICKANLTPAGSFSLSGNCWLEAGPPQAPCTKGRVMQPGACAQGRDAGSRRALRPFWGANVSFKVSPGAIWSGARIS